MKRVRVLLLIVMACGAPAGAAPPKVPILYSTDLYHPHGDPDDHYDLATLLAIQEFDVKGIVIDVRLEEPANVGRAPLEQMMHITDRRIPYAVGARRRLRTPTDDMRDDPAEYQGGIDLILSVLRDTKERQSVVVILAGSCRDLAAAYNREPDLLREKVKAVYCNAGNGLEGVQWEWNVRLDPQAYERLFGSGLPLYWCPCWGAVAGQPDRHATFFRVDQAAVVGDCAPAVQNFFVYCLTRSQADPVTFLSSGPHPLPTGKRNMWCTASFVHAAGRRIYRSEQGFSALTPAEALAAGRGVPVETFRFVPMRATLASPPADAAALSETPPGELAAVLLSVELNPADPNGFVFETVGERYEEILASVLQNLLAGLNR